MNEPKEYLGDSVYVEVKNCMLVLTTNNGLPSDPSNVIFLEWGVWLALKDYVKRYLDPDSE